MLVIGFQLENNQSFHFDIDVDPATDSPRKIHDALSKKAQGAKFSSIVCVEDDAVVATFTEDDDYDLAEDPEDDELDEDAGLDDLDGDESDEDE